MSEASPSESYSVVVTGKIAEGFELSQVKGNVGKLFKLDDAKVEKLFAGKPVAIRRGVEKGQALKLRAALAKAGAIAAVKVARSKAVEEQAVQTVDETATVEAPVVSSNIEISAGTSVETSVQTPTEITCPRCGHEQAFATACSSCKMDLTLHLQRLKRKEEMRAFRRQQAG
ncbi:hypothetical protein [Oceanicoccus sagamiensis]|uniref:Uncharacterized protein n=1 Tax=Oceanicoccus sagamiensis TaxID=716816 RepID=A0A1X9N7Z8_9GAMM|nr:hypothetical protein [Oceanicoccus sagamiensis]ARN74190.1 hypothetical protein BST96_08695 [Oceanicoccus sagamiensis]